MKFASRIAAAAILLAAAPLTAVAAPILTITSPNDLANVNVGQVLTFHVNVTNVDPAQPLDTLAATVRTPVGTLSDPTDPVAGSALPDPLGFLGASAAVEGNTQFEFYGDYFSPDGLITADGTFFTFTLTAAAPGTATLSFLPGSASAFPAGGTDPITVNADSTLSFQVSIPEPSLLTPMLLTSLLLRRATRARR